MKKGTGERKGGDRLAAESAQKRLSYLVYRLIRLLVWTLYPKMKVVGAENIPEGPAVIVGNHAKMNAPISCELYFPGRHRTWTAAEMMHIKEVPAYAFNDFWSLKPGYIRWLYKCFSYVIAPVSVCVFNNADCIGVYHDSRIINTFRSSIRALHDGIKVIILPEHDAPYNNILCDFHEKFVDLGRMYYKRYNEKISFLPMYIAPALKSLYLGKPVSFDPVAPIAEERSRICNALMTEITEIARGLPEHTVIPYPNVPKKLYPLNSEVNKKFDTNGVFETQE